MLNHALILTYLFLRSFFYGVSAIGSLQFVVGTQVASKFTSNSQHNKWLNLSEESSVKKLSELTVQDTRELIGNIPSPSEVDLISIILPHNAQGILFFIQNINKNPCSDLQVLTPF